MDQQMICSSLINFLHHADCGGANYARDKGIPVIVFPETKDGSEGLSPHNLVIALRSVFSSLTNDLLIIYVFNLHLLMLTIF